MSVQVVYKNKAKSSNLGVIALFTEDKFQSQIINIFKSNNFLGLLIFSNLIVRLQQLIQIALRQLKEK